MFIDDAQNRSKLYTYFFFFFCFSVCIYIQMRTLLQSFPFAILMVVSLLSIDNVSEQIHIYFIVSVFVSLITIVLSLTLYDHRTLNRDLEEKIPTLILYFCNFMYRLFSTIARVVILSFLIALFPWYYYLQYY